MVCSLIIEYDYYAAAQEQLASGLSVKANLLKLDCILNNLWYTNSYYETNVYLSYKGNSQVASKLTSNFVSILKYCNLNYEIYQYSLWTLYTTFSF